MLATTTQLNYSDASATNSNVPSFVSAVDTMGNEGPQAFPSVYWYRWEVAYQSAVDYSYGVTENSPRQATPSREPTTSPFRSFRREADSNPLQPSPNSGLRS